MGGYKMKQSRKIVWRRTCVRRVLAVLLMLFTVLGATSGPALAGKVGVGDPPPQTRPALSRSTVTMKSGIDSVSITVKNASSFTATVDQPWLTRTISGNTITLKTMGTNNSGANRTGNLTVKAEGYTLKCKVTQRPKLTASLTQGGSAASSVWFAGAYDEGEGKVPARKLYVTAGASITAKTNYSWIHVSYSGMTVTVRVDDNYSGSDRYGSITISDGANTLSFQVSQSRYHNIYNSYKAYQPKYISTDLVDAFRPFRSNQFYNDPGTYCMNLISATCRHYGISNPQGWIIADQQTLISNYGFTEAQIAGLYAVYIFEADVVVVNLTNATSPSIIAQAIFHELRHKWQGTCKYNSGRAQYLMRYGVDHYTNANDVNQNVEKDACDYANKLMDLLTNNYQ